MFPANMTLSAKYNAQMPEFYNSNIKFSNKVSPNELKSGLGVALAYY